MTSKSPSAPPTTATAPTITRQPASQTLTAGQSATFTVVASGTAPLSYQWQKNGTNIADATGSSYMTPSAATADSGSKFDVVVSNTAGTATSNVATLTVNATMVTVSFSPTTLTFGNQTVGTSSSAQFVTFSNTSSGTLTFGAKAITGDFSFGGQGTCSSSLAAAASCTMGVKFTPTTTGTETGTLTVSDNASTSPEVVALTGAGISSTSTALPCTAYVSPAGSDSDAGTISAPWQTAQKAFDSATAGQTVCFRGGTYPQYIAATSGFNQVENNSGSPGNPIVFTNYPGEIALLQGSTRVNGSYVTFRGTPQSAGSCYALKPCGLIFEGSSGYVLGAVSICCVSNYNSHFVIFDHVEIRHGNYHYGLYEEGCNNAIVGSYVHDNGLRDRSEDNGIYWSVTPPGCTNGGLIANNVVEHNYSKGIQVYDGGSTTEPAYVIVTENTSANNGAQGAVLWGDHNVFVNNILYSNNNLSGGVADSAQGALYSGTNTLVDHNLTFDSVNLTGHGWYNPGGCCITPNNNWINPLFVNVSGLDWHLLATSPAIGYSNTIYIQPADKDGVSRSSSPSAGAYQQ